MHTTEAMWPPSREPRREQSRVRNSPSDASRANNKPRKSAVRARALRPLENAPKKHGWADITAGPGGSAASQRQRQSGQAHRGRLQRQGEQLEARAAAPHERGIGRQTSKEGCGRTRGLCAHRGAMVAQSISAHSIMHITFQKIGRYFTSVTAFPGQAAGRGARPAARWRAASALGPWSPWTTTGTITSSRCSRPASGTQP